MVKPSNRSVGLLGGSFDPAHKGHLAISKIAIKKNKIDKVLWVVTKQNPLKKKPFYSIAQRIERAKKLTKRIKKINVMYLDKTLGSSRSINIVNYLINNNNIKKNIKNISKLQISKWYVLNY